MQVRVDVLFPDFQNPAFCDQEGNSPLHHIALLNCSIEEFKSSTDELFAKENDMFLEMLTTPNNEGKMPFQLIKPNSQDAEKKNHILANYMRKKQIKPITALMNVDDILKQYYPNNNPQLLNNLTIACNVVNETRSIFKESYTHPDIHFYSIEAQEELLDRTWDMIDSLNQYRVNYLTEAVSIAKKTAIGNCTNYTYAALDILMSKFSKEVYAQRFRIEGGDHSFIVIDNEYKFDTRSTWKKLPVTIKEDKVSPINAQSLMSTWWSNTAVVCDPWAGAAYPIQELPLKLMNHEASFEQDRRKTNWLGPVNSKFHFFQKANTKHVDDKAQAFYKKIHEEKIARPVISSKPKY